MRHVTRTIKIGIIGGSGLDNPEIMQNARDAMATTGYGMPSSPLKIGMIGGVDVVLLARHGREHTIPPSQVNYRANIQALKDQGVTHILATTACGSLREDIGRGDFVILDQFIDFTKQRKTTFFEAFRPNEIKHTPMAMPFSEELRAALNEACASLDLTHHPRGTVITIEGPRFSTKAESNMFRALGADVINMSIAPEAILANEAGIPYGAVAMSTDYDCWKEGEKPVTWEEVLAIFNKNVEKVTRLLAKAVLIIAKGPKAAQQRAADKDPRLESIESIKSKIRTIPDWPKKGIMFRDITTMLKDTDAFKKTINLFVERYGHNKIDIVAGIESRGFIIGAALAHSLNVGFIPIRKAGKLPGKTVKEEYSLEYGTASIEIHIDAIEPGTRVLLIDDLLATGGTALAACNLLKKLGAVIVECGFIIDLPTLGGKKKLTDAGHHVFNLIEFEGE